MNLKKTRVIFFQVQSPSAKLKFLCESAQSHFEKKEPFLILVEDLKAKEFADELLWKFPPNSFLPHVATDEKTQELVAITKTKNNVNQARVAFNLCTTPLLIQTPFRIIYEFEDLTSPSKNRLSSLRFNAYKEEGFLIESRA